MSHLTALCTAIVFFFRQCEQRLPRDVDATWSAVLAALLLACKATENSRRPRDVINVCHFVRHKRVMSINEVRMGGGVCVAFV